MERFGPAGTSRTVQSKSLPNCINHQHSRQHWKHRNSPSDAHLSQQATMSSTEEAPPQGPAWRRERKAFARFSDSPLASLSSSLTSARRSADNLLHVAAEAERKLKAEGERIKAEFERQAKTTSTKLRASLQHLQPPLGDEWGNAMGGNPSAGKRRDRSRSRMRRVRSAADFRRGSRLLTGSSAHDEGKEWDLFAALNNTLSANRSPIAGSPYQAPSTFQDQVCFFRA